MQRGRLLLWTGLFAAGIAGQHWAGLEQMHWLLLIAVQSVVVAGTVVRGRRANLFVALLIVSWGGWWCAKAEAGLEDGLDHFIENGPVVVRGTVVSHPEVEDDRVYVVVHVAEVSQRGVTAHPNTRLRLTVVDAPPLSYGDVLHIRAELRRPSPATNPGAFDYRAWLHRQGITVTAFVPYSRHVQVVGSKPPNLFMHGAGNLRNGLLIGLDRALASDDAAVAAAVVLGQRRQLSLQVEEEFRRAGMSHLLAVSGLHVGFVVVCGYAVLRLVRVPAPARALLTILVTWLYVLATGARPPAVRAGVMATAGLASSSLGRRRDGLTALAAGALCLLVSNPLLLFDVSFQLSFAATAAIVWWFAPIRRRLAFLPAPVATGCALTAAAQIGVAPLLAHTFQQLSLVGFIGSLIGTPIVSVLVPIGAVTGLVHGMSGAVGAFLAGSFLGTATTMGTTVVVRALTFVARSLASLSWASVDVAPPSVAVIAGWWLFWWAICQGGLPARRRRRAVLAAAVLVFGALWLPLVQQVFDPRLVMVVLDVGQGDAIFIRTPDGVTALVDGGGNVFAVDESGTNPGETVTLPYLRYAGVGVVDVVVNTHPHEDHLQGLLPILSKRPVALAVDGGPLTSNSTWSSPTWREYLQLIEDNEVVRWEAVAGDVIRLGRTAKLEVLHPRELMSGTRSDLNNNSVVMRLVYGDTAALLTGDIESEAQLDLLRRGVNLRADVVKVPHHGSRWSLVSAFYEAVGADIAVIPVGRNNYGHPAPEVVAALENMGMRVYRTDTDGSVMLTSDGKQWTVRTMRR